MLLSLFLKIIVVYYYCYCCCCCCCCCVCVWRSLSQETLQSVAYRITCSTRVTGRYSCCC